MTYRPDADAYERWFAEVAAANAPLPPTPKPPAAAPAPLPALDLSALPPSAFQKVPIEVRDEESADALAWLHLPEPDFNRMARGVVDLGRLNLTPGMIAYARGDGFDVGIRWSNLPPDGRIEPVRFGVVPASAGRLLRRVEIQHEGRRADSDGLLLPAPVSLGATGGFYGNMEVTITMPYRMDPDDVRALAKAQLVIVAVWESPADVIRCR